MIVFGIVVVVVLATLLMFWLFLFDGLDMIFDWLESRGDKKARKRVSGFKRKTETTISFTSEGAYPTLAEVIKFVEEAQLAGVDLDATVRVRDSLYSDTTTKFEVTQALDM